MNPLHNYHHDDRPWGSFDQFTKNEPSTVKLLYVDADMRFSLQRHHHRTEFWRVVSGSGTARIADDERKVTVGDELTIPEGTLHRLTGGAGGITVLEISFGDFDENDIERVEDDFGRSQAP